MRLGELDPVVGSSNNLTETPVDGETAEMLHAAFTPGAPYPYLYRDNNVMSTVRRRQDAQPEVTAAAGVRVFDMSVAEDVSVLTAIMQLEAWRQGKIDNFIPQFDQNTGNFKILCVWRRFFRMAPVDLANNQMSVWRMLGAG